MSNPFSAKNARKAAIWTASYLDGKQGEAFGLMDKGKQAAQGYLDQSKAGYGTAYDQARTLLTKGYGDANTALTSAKSHWQPYQESGVRANAAYDDAMGLNGAEGRARATDAFRSNPGYEWMRDQGMDSIMRTAAARGGLSSGNTSVDLLKYTTGLADQTYGNYLERLRPIIQGGQTAAAGMSQVDSLVAQLAQQRGRDQANLETGLADKIAALNTGHAGLESDLANNKANVLLDIAGQTAQAGQNAFAAADKAAANRFGAITGGIELATKLLSAAFGGPAAAAGGAGGGAGGGGGFMQGIQSFLKGFGG